jgi:YebC/PmpR family DNA-binding regulatory protein
MSGHSKWHRIKHKKAATDSKRGQEFTKLTSAIVSAARDNPNPDQNASLRDAIARAKSANMPQANIDKLLLKQSESEQQSITYEAFGPGGAALLILTRTDSANRTVAEIRAILKKVGGTISEPGGVMWKFEAKSLFEYTVKYPQTTSPDNLQKINQLVQELHEQPDVEKVFCDISE